MPNDDTLKRLEVLREFKRKMQSTKRDVNISPFDDRVSTVTTDPTSADLGDIHAGVREHIRDTILAVRNGQKPSQVVLLSGAAGAGKTHLLRSFQQSAAMEQLGHVFVGGSNHWRIDEFEARLLDWIIEALTAPDPSETHPLLERIQAIGFRAAEHLLESKTWRTYLAAPSWKWLRFWPFRKQPSGDRLRDMLKNRDPRLFLAFDFAKFSDYVCGRFLAQRSNIQHRFVMRVLLKYLFPDSPETGIGTQERVLHWFRGRGEDEYFTKLFGASERPDRAYSQMEAVKLLAHLFSGEVSKQLSTDSAPCHPRVFLLTFDQAEGRNELFDSDDDWKTFFAHLSELYNTLPNVVVLFTMTLPLRTRLHGIMERQFQDRIRMDDRFMLRTPSQEQILGLYRARIETWLRDELFVRDQYRELENPYLPLTPERIIAAGNRSLRETLEVLDSEFHDAMNRITVGPELDYLYQRNELKKAEANENEWDYTADHLGIVSRVLEMFGSLILEPARLDIREQKSHSIDGVSAIRFSLIRPGQWPTVVITLARLGWNYSEQLKNLSSQCLYNREKAKNFVFVIRPQPIPGFREKIEVRYRDQFADDLCSVETESKFRALCNTNERRDSYDAAQQAALDELVRKELQSTHLANLLRWAGEKLDALIASPGESRADSEQS